MTASWISLIPGIVTQSAVAAQEAVAATLVDIRAGAEARSRVLTGELKSSWRIVDDSVVSDSDHAAFNEFGTVHMAAQPMLTPASEEARPAFIARAHRIYSP
ncbi:MAG: hypothetical protein V4703_12865 [Actinomycetota bacterium]